MRGPAPSLGVREIQFPVAERAASAAPPSATSDIRLALRRPGFGAKAGVFRAVRGNAKPGICRTSPYCCTCQQAGLVGFPQSTFFTIASWSSFLRAGGRVL